MSLDHIYRNPRDAMRVYDSWTRLTALAAMVRDPLPADREIFEDLLESDDITSALLAFLGLKKLLPAPSAIREFWKELFGESVDLLTRRACSGPAQLRVAALKALAFAPEHLNFGLVEQVLKSLDIPLTHETVLSGQTPSLALVRQPQNFFLPEGFAILLASLPGGHDRVNLIRRELSSTENARLVPALISLQLNPAPELTDQVLTLARSAEKRVALEAARALAACGGSKVYLVLLSLLKEASDPSRKAWLLPLAAGTGREEVWPVIQNYAGADDPVLVKSAIRAAAGFAVPVEEKAELFNQLMRSSDPGVVATAAQFAWHVGSMKALRLLEKLLNSEDSSVRAIAAEALGGISGETAVPLIAARFEAENNGDVIRQMILSLRALLPKARGNMKVYDQLLPWFNRLLKSTDAFKRSQCAVLCGFVGRPAQDIVLQALEREHHPHVLASLLTALGSSGFDRLLVYSRFCDHIDSRVRANALTAMLVCGGDAVSYFTAALRDNVPRVRGIAAKNLFLLGQLDIVATLNRMLLVPEPISVLSGCHALGQLLRIQPPTLSSDHPLPLALSRKTRLRTEAFGPALLNSAEIPGIFCEMAMAAGNNRKLVWILEEKYRRFPGSYAIRRMLAALLISNSDFERAASLLDIGIRENSGILADLLDAYRISIRLGNLEKANTLGETAKKLYDMLLDGCMQLCRTIRGSGAELMLEKLHHLNEPSMNLYNAMIQLKVIENDQETVVDLMAELVLARPCNAMVLRKLAGMLPESFAQLRHGLEVFAASLPERL